MRDRFARAGAGPGRAGPRWAGLDDCVPASFRVRDHAERNQRAEQLRRLRHAHARRAPAGRAPTSGSSRYEVWFATVSTGWPACDRSARCGVWRRRVDAPGRRPSITRCAWSLLYTCARVSRCTTRRVSRGDSGEAGSRDTGCTRATAFRATGRTAGRNQEREPPLPPWHDCPLSRSGVVVDRRSGPASSSDQLSGCVCGKNKLQVHFASLTIGCSRVGISAASFGLAGSRSRAAFSSCSARGPSRAPSRQPRPKEPPPPHAAACPSSPFPARAISQPSAHRAAGPRVPEPRASAGQARATRADVQCPAPRALPAPCCRRPSRSARTRQRREWGASEQRAVPATGSTWSTAAPARALRGSPCPARERRARTQHMLTARAGRRERARAHLQRPVAVQLRQRHRARAQALVLLLRAPTLVSRSRRPRALPAWRARWQT